MSLSSFEIRRDVRRGRLRISGEFPLNARVVYGIEAKHVRCIVTFSVTHLKSNSAACDIMSNLVPQRVALLTGRNAVSG